MQNVKNGIALDLNNEADCRTARAVAAFSKLDVEAQDQFLAFLRAFVAYPHSLEDDRH